jgi:hypothetical protein
VVVGVEEETGQHQRSNECLPGGTDEHGSGRWHRSHRYKAERMTMGLFAAGEGGFAANNIVAIR